LPVDGENSFERVYQQYADMMYRVALSHVSHREDAEDVVHDVFIKYMEALPTFSDDEHERAWLVRATINRCHDLLRRGKIREHESLDDITDLPSEENGTATDLFRTLAELPEKYKTAIVLHYLEGFSVEEVARMLGISLSAVKMRLSRGRELLKNILNDEEKSDV
jgi:RNA polymerase sigma-70 factor (ECF subfamily)